MNCIHLFRAKSKLESQKNVCEDKDLCGVVMLLQGTKIVGINQHQKPNNKHSIIYADFESLIEIVERRKNNFEKFIQTYVSIFSAGTQCQQYGNLMV